jgi:GeoRSP system PqqD family protein
MSGELVHHPDIVWRDEPELREEILEALERGEDVGEKGWVIVMDGGIMHQLNLLAGEIWLLCDGSHDEESISSVLAEQFDAPREEILADVREFTGTCLNKGWLLRKGV